jgi:hypothetical protein
MSVALCAAAALLLPIALHAADAPPSAAPPAAAVPLSYSSPDTDTTPIGNLRFHGPFGNNTLSISADKIPPHDFLDISCDLLILRSWDGSTQITQEDLKPAPIGPDFLRIGLHGGPTLLYTTFCNLPDDPQFKGEKTQNYPSVVPGDQLEAAGGSISHNSLGYHYPVPGPPQLEPMDAVYHLHFLVPHKGGEAMLEFTGLNLQDLIDENWGVMNVEVHAVGASDVPKPSADEIAAALTACAKADPKTDVPGAFQTLINGMDDTVAWMDAHVKPVPIDASAVPDLLKDLGSGDENMTAREAAHPALVKLGIQIEPLLRDARKNAPGELRHRIDWALESLDVSYISDDGLRRVMIATRALEIIGTPKALELRKKLTQN